MKKIFFLVCIIFSIILSMSFVSAMDVNEPQNNAVLKDNVNIIDVGSGDFSQLSHYVKSDNYIILNGDITRSPSNSDLSIEKNVTIDGNGHTINANNLGRIFSIYGGELTLKNLKLKNGNLDGPG